MPSRSLWTGQGHQKLCSRPIRSVMGGCEWQVTRSNTRAIGLSRSGYLTSSHHFILESRRNAGNSSLKSKSLARSWQTTKAKLLVLIWLDESVQRQWMSYTCDVTILAIRHFGLLANKAKLHVNGIIVFTFVKTVNFCALCCCVNRADWED